MEDANNTYRLPANFNPYATADTARALAGAIHQSVTEGEMTERPLPKHALGKLQALTELLQRHVQELHEYLREIENRTTLDLPLTDEELGATSVDKNGVREEPAIYAVR